MATVQLDKLWVHRANDLATHVIFNHHTALDATRKREGEVIELAGGRMAYRGRPTVQTTYTARIRSSSRTALDLLYSWVGTPVLVRDYAGNAVFGVFHEVASTDVGFGTGLRDITLVIHELSISEEV